MPTALAETLEGFRAAAVANGREALDFDRMLQLGPRVLRIGPARADHGPAEAGHYRDADRYIR